MGGSLAPGLRGDEPPVKGFMWLMRRPGVRYARAVRNPRCALRAFVSTLVAIACGAAISSSANAALLVSLGGPGVYKPRSYCPANHMCFKHARWLVWGST